MEIVVVHSRRGRVLHIALCLGGDTELLSICGTPVRMPVCEVGRFSADGSLIACFETYLRPCAVCDQVLRELSSRIPAAIAQPVANPAAGGGDRIAAAGGRLDSFVTS